MLTKQHVLSLRFIFLLMPLILLSASACTYQGDEFSFSAPIGFKTKQYEIPETNPDNKPESLIFSKNGHVSFWITRQTIPVGSDLAAVFNAFKARSIEVSTHYQFISQGTVEINDRTAIEYVYRTFSGEGYWQRRDVWMENNGRAYALTCSDPADATPGLVIPVSEECIRLVEGFQFK